MFLSSVIADHWLILYKQFFSQCAVKHELDIRKLKAVKHELDIRKLKAVKHEFNIHKLMAVKHEFNIHKLMAVKHEFNIHKLMAVKHEFYIRKLIAVKQDHSSVTSLLMVLRGAVRLVQKSLVINTNISGAETPPSTNICKSC